MQVAQAVVMKRFRDLVCFALPSMGALGLLGGCSIGSGGTNPGLDNVPTGGNPSPAGRAARYTLTKGPSFPDAGDDGDAGGDAGAAGVVHLSGTLSGFWGPCDEITCSNTLVLQNSGGDDLTLTDNGVFTFATPLSPGHAFEVTVLRQPQATGSNGAQTCVVSAGTGVARSQDITDVLIDCTTNAYTIGGTVSGLLAGRGGLSLSSFAFTTIPKGGHRFEAQQGLYVAGDGSPSEKFTFPTPVLSSSIYSANLYEQAPLGQSCALTGGGSGRVIDANITNLEFTCTTVPYLYSFETGIEGLHLASWQQMSPGPGVGNTGETSQTSDFHTQGLSGLRINAGPGAQWFGAVYNQMGKRASIDLSGSTHLRWDVETVLDPTTQELALQTGDNWTWCQGGGWPWLEAGTTTAMDVDLTSLDCNVDLSQVHALYFYFGNGSTGTYYIDNVRAE
jgi:hypothetical protein